MKVYIVVEEDRDECHNHGVYSTYESALEAAEEDAEYAGLEKIDEWTWGNEEEDVYVFIETHEVA
jgi:hypothetical protein